MDHGFNPTLVRLRHEWSLVVGVAGVHCFNPTLVRLRQVSPPLCPSGIIRFQSHAGSIEAPSGEGPGGRGPRVSIPRWFD